MLGLRRIKNFFFGTVSLALNLRLGEACRAKTKLFILLRLNMAPRDKGLLSFRLVIHSRGKWETKNRARYKSSTERQASTFLID